jgi:MFS family permease
MVRLLSMRPFLMLVVTVTAMSFAFGFIMPVVPLFLQQLAGRQDVLSVAGVIFGLGGLVGALSSAVMGRFSDVLGPRRVLVGGLWAAGVFHMAQGFATSVAALGALVVLSGLATGAIRPVANAFLTRIIEEEDRGKAFGVMSSVAALGWALGPMAGGYMGAVHGFRSVFFATAALFLVVGAWVWFALRSDGSKR